MIFNTFFYIRDLEQLVDFKSPVIDIFVVDNDKISVYDTDSAMLKDVFLIGNIGDGEELVARQDCREEERLFFSAPFLPFPADGEDLPLSNDP